MYKICPQLRSAPIFREFSNQSIVDLATLPGREVGGVPLAAALGPHLAAEAALDVHQRFHVVRVVQDVPAESKNTRNDTPSFRELNSIPSDSDHMSMLVSQMGSLSIIAPFSNSFTPEERDVGDGEAEGVDLGEALLVGEGRHVQPQLLERRVDARRAAQHKIRYKGDPICSSRFCPMKVGQWRNFLAHISILGILILFLWTTYCMPNPSCNRNPTS